MKQTKKFAALGLTICAFSALAACGGKGEDKTYTVTYDNTLAPEVLEGIPEYQFIANDLSFLVAYGTNLDVTLDLEKDGSYTLTSKYYNQNPETKAGDAEYIDVHMEAKGTYTKEEDKVTISKATEAVAVYDGGAYVTEQGMLASYSFAEDESTGTWSSADVPEVLECVPETVFTVNEDGTIVTWEAAGIESGNPHREEEDEAEEEETETATEEATEAVEETEAVTEESTEAEEETEAATEEATEAVDGTETAENTFVMYASDTDAITMTFNADGTCQFAFADYGITEDCTWVFADGNLTVTKSDGNTCVSEMDGDKMKLTYVSVASDQMVGNLESTDWSVFFK